VTPESRPKAAPEVLRTAHDDTGARLPSVTNAVSTADDLEPEDMDWLPRPVDWKTFWEAPVADPEYVIAPLFAAGRQTAIFSTAKTGKSLLVLDMVAAAVTGRSVLGLPARPPIRAVYIDMEMTEADLRERLSDLGYGPDNDLSRLRYFQLPSLPPLDTELGGLVLAEVVAGHNADLVIIDTMARVVTGDENSSDTYRAFYRHTGLRLKTLGVALARLDHMGKDNDAWAKPGWARQVEAVPRFPKRFGQKEAVVGRGQWQRRDVRPVVEDQLGLDVRVLRRGGGLTPGASYRTAWKVGDHSLGAADIFVGEAVMDLRAVHPLSGSATGSFDVDRTPCPYGGTRTWLVCPGCGSRRCVLYLSARDGFLCRSCLDLTYRSSQLSKTNRKFSRMRNLADRLGLDLASGQLVGQKGMHGTTTMRIMRQYATVVSALTGSGPSWLDAPTAPSAGSRQSDGVA